MIRGCHSETGKGIALFGLGRAFRWVVPAGVLSPGRGLWFRVIWVYFKGGSFIQQAWDGFQEASKVFRSNLPGC